MNNTAALAHAITKAGSKHSYFTARLLADRDLVDDCLRAYAYFRWADDLVDGSSQSTFNSMADRIAFIDRQKFLIKNLYLGERPDNLCPEEEMLADLIAHDRGLESGLHSFIYNFMAVIEFDAKRKGQLVSRGELAEYTSWLATAVMDGIQYFIGNGHSYPKNLDRNLAVTGAHLAHMLRDMLEDLPNGFINIPAEELQMRNIHLENVDGEPFHFWVRDQAEQARKYLLEGKRYIDSLDVLRCKLAGAWYCARFEWYLDAIRRDGYRLRRVYPDCQGMSAWLKMALVGLVVILKHFSRRFWRERSQPEPLSGTSSD